jgi:hypothetical protein
MERGLGAEAAPTLELEKGSMLVLATAAKLALQSVPEKALMKGPEWAVGSAGGKGPWLVAGTEQEKARLLAVQREKLWATATAQQWEWGLGLRREPAWGKAWAVGLELAGEAPKVGVSAVPMALVTEKTLGERWAVRSGLERAGQKETGLGVGKERPWGEGLV